MTLTSIVDVNGYGSGAPHGACYDLEPQHYGVLPKDPKQNQNPYIVETLQGDYLFSPGREIQCRQWTFLCFLYAGLFFYSLLGICSRPEKNALMFVACVAL